MYVPLLVFPSELCRRPVRFEAQAQYHNLQLSVSDSQDETEKVIAPTCGPVTTDVPIVRATLISRRFWRRHLDGTQVSDLCTVFDESIVSFWGTCTFDDARKAFAG